MAGARSGEGPEGPADTPQNLGATLERLGLERAESELAMALPLRGSTAPARQVTIYRRLGFANFGEITEYKPRLSSSHGLSKVRR